MFLLSVVVGKVSRRRWRWRGKGKLTGCRRTQLTGCDCKGEPSEGEGKNPHPECFDLVSEDRNCSRFCQQRELTCSDECGWKLETTDQSVVGRVYNGDNCNGDKMRWHTNCLISADSSPETWESIECCCAEPAQE